MGRPPGSAALRRFAFGHFLHSLVLLAALSVSAGAAPLRRVSGPFCVVDTARIHFVLVTKDKFAVITLPMPGELDVTTNHGVDGWLRPHVNVWDDPPAVSDGSEATPRRSLNDFWTEDLNWHRGYRDGRRMRLAIPNPHPDSSMSQSVMIEIVQEYKATAAEPDMPIRTGVPGVALQGELERTGRVSVASPSVQREVVWCRDRLSKGEPLRSVVDAVGNRLRKAYEHCVRMGACGRETALRSLRSASSTWETVRALEAVPPGPLHMLDCDDLATAMVAVLRGLDVPAATVVTLVPGQSEYCSDRDAETAATSLHAIVEFHNGEFWEQFDPTCGSGPIAEPQVRLASAMNGEWLGVDHTQEDGLVSATYLKENSLRIEVVPNLCSPEQGRPVVGKPEGAPKSLHGVEKR